jgi:hypothetical protein
MDLITTQNQNILLILSGDDYWTDPLKLQNKLIVLGQNEECNIVWTKFNKINAYWGFIEIDMHSLKKECYNRRFFLKVQIYGH